MTRSKNRSDALYMRPRDSSALCLRKREHIIGVSVSETMADTRMVTARVTANSLNKRPTMSPMNKSGINTATSEIVSDMIVKPICSAPFNAASSGLSPCSIYRTMFSIITMASSTTKPVEMVSAISVRLLRLKPSRYITAKVPMRESGTAMLGMIVAANVRRKTKMTATTSAMHRQSSNSTSATDARTVVVRSVRTEILIVGGIVALSFGSSALMRSTTAMMLAPGWRWMFTITAGTLFIQADAWVFSTPSTTLATDLSMTGDPPL